MSWELESDARSLLWDRLVHPQLCYLKKVQVCAPQFPLSPVLLVPAAPPPVWGREGEGTCPQLCLWLDHLAPPSGGPQVANGQRIYISKDILHWQTVWASLGGCSLVCEQREGLCLPPAVSGANVGAL